MRLGALCVISVLAFAGTAVADNKKVDWSQYLETPAERAAAKKPAAKPSTKQQPVAKAQPKRVAPAKARSRTAAAKPRRR